MAAGIALVVALSTGGGGGTGSTRAATDLPGGHTAPTTTAAGAAVSNGVAVDPAQFATGACMAFAPTAGDDHHTVFIDAGHGGLDPGAVGKTSSGQSVHEATETLPVALDTMALLRAQGFRVVVSRTKNTTVSRPGPGDLTGGIFTPAGSHADVAARDVCADMAKATVLVGIYFDAGGSTVDAGSITAYDAARAFSAANQRLATLVQRDVLARLNAHGWDIPDDGVVSDTSLGGPAMTPTAASYDHLLLLGPADPGWFTTPSTMPGALIEPLFITDPFEATIAASATGQEAIAGGMAQAVEQYFSSATAGATPTASATG